MSGDDRFEVLISLLLVAGLPVFVLWRAILWVRTAPRRPDPWDAETEEIIQRPDAIPTCHHCSVPYSPEQWFCEHCGSAVGTYNNWMPYVYLFSIGEVFRTGARGRFRVNALTVVGYLVLSYNYLILAPVFWFLLFRNCKRIKTEDSHKSMEDDVA